MKNIKITLYILLLSLNTANAQSVFSSEISQKSRAVNQNRSSYNRHGGSRYYHRNRDYISMGQIERKVKQLKNRINDSEKYSSRKKNSMDNELNHALRKFREADINNDGVLNDREMDVYGNNVFIDY